MWKVTESGVQQIGKIRQRLSDGDGEEIGNMFEQFSKGIIFPDKEDDWDGQTIVYRESE